MPVYAAIAPFNGNDHLTIDNINSNDFYNATMANRKSNTSVAELKHFEHIFEFMVDPKSSRGAAIYSFLIACAAFASCFILFIQTLDGPNHDPMYPDYPSLPTKAHYYIADVVFTAIFTVELVVRVVIWPSLWKEHDYLTERRMRPWLKDVFNWFDVAAVAPFYMDLMIGSQKSFVVVRLCRLLRIFKLARNHSGTYILMRAIKGSVAPIAISLIFFLEIMLFFSVVLYVVDPNYDRNKSGFTDLLASGYFVVVTVATIGYGDIVPTKNNMYSRCFAVMVILSGTLFLSMPLAIIGTEFERAWKEHTDSLVHYQQQGKLINASDLTNENNPEAKQEVLVKYNLPNVAYLQLASAVGELSIMVQHLTTEVDQDETSATTMLEIMEDITHQIELVRSKSCQLCEVVMPMIAPKKKIMQEDLTLRRRLHKTLSDPESSRTARYISRWTNTCLVLSMLLVVWQTMPDLQTYGEDTFLCERVVKRYCEMRNIGLTSSSDPGCFQWNNSQVPLKFGCSQAEKASDPACYGAGWNFGASGSVLRNATNRNALSCDQFPDDENPEQVKSSLPSDSMYQIHPFQRAQALPIASRNYQVCNKFECDNYHLVFFDFGQIHVVLEYTFTVTFLFEMVAELVTCARLMQFLKKPIVYVEILSFVPFFIYEARRFLYHQEPIYVIPPGSTDWLTVLRMLRLFRIFRIHMRIPAARVLWESISKTWRRLTIPYIMLVLVTTIFSFLVFEMEKGTECFYGQPCIVQGKTVTFPDDYIGSPPNKRILINSKGQVSAFDDFFSAFWFVIVTLGTIGYGDMEAKTMTGRLVSVVVMLFGACYTAMPLTLVGSQFNKSYREYKRREALQRTKVEVNKPHEVEQADIEVWLTFGEQKLLTRMTLKLNDLWMLVDGPEKFKDEIDPLNKGKIKGIVAELKRYALNERTMVMQTTKVVSILRKEGMRLAQQQTLALQRA